jgi:hypothetical protein
MLRLPPLVAVLALLLAAPAAAPAQVPQGFFGVMVNGPLEDRRVDLGAEAATMRAAGVRSWRIEIAWDKVEPQRGALDWAATDRKILAAAAQGIAVMPVLVRAPEWASGDPFDPFVPPRQAGLFGGFAQAVALRYGPGGSLWREHPEVAARPVRHWQLWNEPNLRRYLNARDWPAVYGRLLRAGHAGLRRADPRSRVVLAGLANFSWRDLSTLLRRGGRLPFDAAAVHPFSDRPSKVLKIARLNREVLDRRGRRRTPLWITELTWSSGRSSKPRATVTWETTRAGQAERLRQGYRLLLRDRRRLRLERVFWYTWASVDRDSPNAFDYSGLRGTRSDGTLVDKPALRAFRRVTAGVTR